MTAGMDGLLLAAFVSESARMSIGATAAIVAFVAAYAFGARRFGTPVSLALASATWLSAALAVLHPAAARMSAAAALLVALAVAVGWNLTIYLRRATRK